MTERFSTLRPHPEERPQAASRRMGCTPCDSTPILRDASLRDAPQDEAEFVRTAAVVIARSAQRDEAISATRGDARLLRGACHRAGQRPDPLARNDGGLLSDLILRSGRRPRLEGWAAGPGAQPILRDGASRL